MTEPRDDLAQRREELARTLAPFIRPHEWALEVADVLLAAYPQLTATESHKEDGVMLPDEIVLNVGPNTADDMTRSPSKLKRVRRTVYATPWEDAS